MRVDGWDAMDRSVCFDSELLLSEEDESDGLDLPDMPPMGRLL